jgi:hypothetical protein
MSKQLTQKSHVDSKHKGLVDHKHKKSNVGPKANTKLVVTKSLKPHVNFNLLFQKIKPQLKELAARRIALSDEKKNFDTKWVSVDMKGVSANPITDKISLVEAEIAVLKSMMLNALGVSKMKAVLISGFNISSTSSSGVVNGVTSITATSFNDFTAVATIFEEYRITRGALHFTALGSTVGNGAVGLIGCVSYNISTSTPAVSAAVLADDTEHKLFLPPNATNAISTFVNTTYHTFKFKVSPGVLDDTGVAAADNWCLVSNSSVPYGYLRPYYVYNSSTVNNNALSALLYADFEFRMRV